MSDKPNERKRALRPRDAATLVLTRRLRGNLCVLMGQRHSGHVFMPDRYVFPGGRVDRADHHARPATPLRDVVAQHLQKSATPGKAQALALAAIRETFEETGLILGKPLNGAAPRTAGPWRAFYDAGYAPALDGLDYICRAITPPYRPRRFNARFFAANGDRVEGKIDGSGELLHLDWIPVKKAMDLPLPNITKYVLENLEALTAARESGKRRGKVPFYRYEYGKHVMSHE